MITGVGLRTVMKTTENTPNPKEGAPVLDPTVSFDRSGRATLKKGLTDADRKRGTLV